MLGRSFQRLPPPHPRPNSATAKPYFGLSDLLFSLDFWLSLKGEMGNVPRNFIAKYGLNASLAAWAVHLRDKHICLA